MMVMLMLMLMLMTRRALPWNHRPTWGPACWSGTRPSIFKGLGASLSPCLFEPVDPFSAPCGARQRSRVLVWQLLFSRSLVVGGDGPPRGEDG